MLDGAVLSETDTIGGGDVSADENTVDNSRPSSRQGNLTTSSRDGKEDKDEKDEKGKDKKAAKHRRGNSIMDLFRVKVRHFSLRCCACLAQTTARLGPHQAAPAMVCSIQKHMALAGKLLIALFWLLIDTQPKTNR